MSRRRKVLFALVGLVALLLGIEWFIESFLFERHREYAEEQLSQALGLPVRIQGEFRLDLGVTSTFVTSEVFVANLPGRPSPHLLSVGELELTFDTWDLLAGRIEVEELDFRNVEVHLETDAEGGLDLEHDVASLTDEPRGLELDFRVDRVGFENMHVFYRPGDEGTVYAARFDVLNLEAPTAEDPIDLVARGEVEGGPLDLSGTFGPLHELLTPTKPYPVALSGQLFEAQLEVNGTIEGPTELRGVDVRVAVFLADPGRALQEQGMPIPKTGPIRASGRLSNRAGPFALTEFDLTTTTGDRMRLHVKGSIADLASLAGVELEVDLEAHDGILLDPFWEGPLPDIDLNATATLSDEDGSLGVEAEVHGGGPGTPLSFDLLGGFDDLRAAREIELRAGARVETLAFLGTLLGLDYELPPLGPIVVRGRLHDRAGRLALDEIDLRVGAREHTWVEVTGSIGNLLEFQKVDLRAVFGAVDLRHARPYFAREPPDVGPVEGEAHLTDRDGTLGVERFRARGGREGEFKIEIEGEFDDLREIDEIEFRVRLWARNLTVVGALLESDLPDVGPIQFDGHIKGSDERVDSEGHARLDKTELDGRWSVVFAGVDRPRIDARFWSPHIYLDDIGLAPGEPPAESLRHGAPVAPAEQDDPFDSLRAFDANVSIHADRASGRQEFALRPFDLRLTLEDGLLEMNLNGEGPISSVQAHVEVDARTPDPMYGLRLDVKNADLTRLMSQLEEQTEFSGRLRLNADLRSRGRTAEAIGSNLNGKLTAVQSGGTFATRYAREFIFDFARVSIPKFRPSGPPPVGCTIIDLEIEDGLARVRNLLIDAPVVTVTGTGTVDFGGGGFDLRLASRIKDPGLVSMAATVKVTGPIADPQFTPVARSLAKSAVGGLFRNAMRPARALVSPLRGRGKSPPENACSPAQLAAVGAR